MSQEIHLVEIVEIVEKNLGDMEREYGNYDETIIQWVDLRENLQETIDFPIKNGIFL